MPISRCAARVALLTARLSALMQGLTRLLVDWAFGAAGLALMSEVLTQAMHEAMAEALT